MRLIDSFLAYKTLSLLRILAGRRLKIRQREEIHQIGRRLIRKFILNEVVNRSRKNRRLSAIAYHQVRVRRCAPKVNPSQDLPSIVNTITARVPLLPPEFIYVI